MLVKSKPRIYSPDWRITTEFIRECFEKEGYKLLTSHYQNCNQKLDFICPNNHHHFTKWSLWQQGRRCYFCSGGAKKTIDEVRFSFEHEGYKLLSEKYINAHLKLNFLCTRNHRHFISWNSWQQGRRCRVCKYLDHGEKVRKSRGITIPLKLRRFFLSQNKERDYSLNRQKKREKIKKDASILAYFRIQYQFHIYQKIRKEFKSFGYFLLSNSYQSSKQKLRYICPNKHIHSVSWSNWQRGQRCPFCNELIRRNNIFEKIKIAFRNENCILLSTEYLGVYHKLDYICLNNHEHSISWNDWQTGYRCLYCKTEAMKDEGNPRFGNGRLIEGPRNPNWRGGVSGESYCSIWKDNEYKEFIEDRDRFKFCWNPQCSGRTENRRRVKHHIDYNKKNCDPMNIITICNSCNSIANFNREYWEKFYSDLNRERFRKAA